MKDTHQMIKDLRILSKAADLWLEDSSFAFDSEDKKEFQAEVQEAINRWKLIVIG